MRVSAALGKADHLEDAHAAIESDGEHVAKLDAVAGCGFPHTVDADVAGLDQRGGAGAGLHDPRMPQPLVEPLAVRVIDPLLDTFSSREPVSTPDRNHVRGRLRLKTLFLAVGGELFLQRRKLGKGRIRIDGAFTLARRARCIGPV